MVIVFPGFGPFPGKHFFYLHCSGSACSDCNEGSGSSTLVVSENILVFYCPFFQFPTIIFLSFFLKLVIYVPTGRYFVRCCSIFGVLIQKWCVYYRLNGSKLTSMVYYNRSTLMILVNNAKYIHFQPIFSTSMSPFTLQVQAIHKINRTLFRYKCWLNHLSTK